MHLVHRPCFHGGAPTTAMALAVLALILSGPAAAPEQPDPGQPVAAALVEFLLALVVTLGATRWLPAGDSASSSSTSSGRARVTPRIAPSECLQ